MDDDVEIGYELSRTYAMVAEQMAQVKRTTLTAIEQMNIFVPHDKGIAAAAAHFEGSGQDYDRLAAALEDASVRMKNWADARQEAINQAIQNLGNASPSGY